MLDRIRMRGGRGCMQIDMISILYSIGWMGWYAGFIVFSSRPQLDK